MNKIFCTVLISIIVFNLFSSLSISEDGTTTTTIETTTTTTEETTTTTMETTTTTEMTTTTTTELPTTTTTIPICSVNVGSGFDFGSLYANSISEERFVTINNDGNVATISLQISGENWNSASTFFDVSSTHFSTDADQDYSAMTALGSTGSDLPNLEPSSLENVYFKVMTPSHQEFGYYSQTITFTVSC